MKLLLAIDRNSDPRIVGAYIGERFGRRGVAVDIVTAIPDSDGVAARIGHVADVVYFPRRTCRHFREAEEFIAAFASELRDRQALKPVRTHIEYGDAGAALIATSLRLRPDLLLMEAPRSRGLLTAFSFDGVTRRVIAGARCPVELLRPHAATPRSLFNVLVPVAMTQLPEFPLRQLQSLAWVRGARLHLAGLLARSFDDSRAEANPATVARELRQEQSARMLARAQLDVLARELLGALPQDVEVVHEVIDDVSSKAIVEAARKTCASLIALPGAASDSGFRGLLSAVSPAAVALAASCSVLLLGSATPSPDPSATPVAPLLPH